MFEVEIQRATDVPGIPDDESFKRWAAAALAAYEGNVELVIRVVDDAEGRELNKQFRGKDHATNVLSFPFEAPPGVTSSHLGDLVICAKVVQQEALDQTKPEDSHWAHMVVHGVLHLLGYDHQTDDEATEMEGLEIRILSDLRIPNPYAVPTS